MTSTPAQARSALLYLTARPTRSIDEAAADFAASLAKAIEAGKLPADVPYRIARQDEGGFRVDFRDGSSAFAIPTPARRKYNWHSTEAFSC